MLTQKYCSGSARNERGEAVEDLLHHPVVVGFAVGLGVRTHRLEGLHLVASPAHPADIHGDDRHAGGAGDDGGPGGEPGLVAEEAVGGAGLLGPHVAEDAELPASLDVAQAGAQQHRVVAVDGGHPFLLAHSPREVVVERVLLAAGNVEE